MTMSTDRDRKFRAMKSGSIPGILDSSIYSIEVASMSEAELLIALGWALTQAARLLGQDRVGVKS